jgi:hypothetical protein
MNNGYTATQAIEAIKDSKGFVTTIANRLGCTRKTVYNLLDRYPTVKEALVDEREMLKDFAESKLFKMIDSEVPAAVFFYLKTQAQDRGYIEQQRIEHSGAVDAKLVILPQKDDK